MREATLLFLAAATLAIAACDAARAARSTADWATFNRDYSSERCTEKANRWFAVDNCSGNCAVRATVPMGAGSADRP